MKSSLNALFAIEALLGCVPAPEKKARTPPLKALPAGVQETVQGNTKGGGHMPTAFVMLSAAANL